MDERGVPISGVIVNLIINGVAYNASTNVGGNWNITYLVNSNELVNVVAEFVGNTNYAAAANTTYFNGMALNSTLIINPVLNTKLKNNVSINGSLFGENNKAIGNVTVVVAVNGVNYNATTDASGKWGITYFVNSTGNINVVAEFNGNNNYFAAVNSTNFNGMSLNSTLIINSVPDTKVNSNVSINGTLLDDNNKVISNVVVVVTVNGVNYNTTTDNSGKWGITYFVNSTGNINVVAEFNGNNNYFAAVNSTNFNVLALNSTLTINSITNAKMNSNISINGTLLDENNKAIINVPVVVIVNGVNYSTTTDASGNWSITYFVNSTGIINVVAEFNGNANYFAAVNSTNFNGMSLNSTLIINSVPDTKVNSNVSINGSLLDENNKVISNVAVVVIVNGVNYSTTTDNSGNWSITYFVNSTGNIDVVAEFNGNANYFAAVNSTNFNGLALNSTLIINPVLDTKVNNSVSINGSLLDENNKAIINVKVVVTVNGVNYNTTTDASGKWSITYPVNSTGIVNVFAAFDGNANYVSAVNSTTFIVTNNVNISIIKIANINGINSVKGHVGDTVIYTIDVVNNGVIDATGVLVTEIIDNTKLKFNKASVTQGYYNNANGLWTIDELTAGKTVTLTINATIIATGNISNSANVSANENNINPNNSSLVTIVSEAILTQINTLNVIVVVDNSVKLESILEDSNGKPIDGKEVKFYVNGKFVGTGVTDVKGIAYFKYTPTKTGTLNYTSSFTDPTGIYLPSTSTSTITITKDKITLTTKLPTGYMGDKKTIKVKVTNSEDKIVPNKTFTAYMNGKKIGTYKTNSKGEFIIKTTLKSSNKLQIKFAGDSKYNKLSKNYTYIAKSKEKTITSIYYAKTKYDKTVTLKAKLTTNKGKALAGKYIKFYVAGKYIGKIKTNKKGIAIFEYTPEKK
ncbi:bacterial Ig-like domain protein [Methanobrevibacter filiformis]|uniref:Bacterial Ig-like domain protein n=1 Tax=Methanobrevibacter filiformis TaxID=55758 RepID=A0A166C3J2_9EURY|nr:bacterial Ig-like domain protein [Methanobrevibacter filiformis]